MVIFGQPIIDQSQVPLLMINHNVQRLDISVHYAVRMCIFHCLQQFVHIQSNVHIFELTGQHFSLNARDVLENETGGLRGRTLHNVINFDNVGPAIKSLQNFDFSVLLFDLDWLEDLDDHLSIVGLVNASEDF